MEDALFGAAHRAAPRRMARLGTVRTEFESALADQAGPAIVAAEIAAAGVADALTIVWDAFSAAAGDDLTGWEVPSASAEVQPGPSLTQPLSAAAPPEALGRASSARQDHGNAPVPARGGGQ